MSTHTTGARYEELAARFLEQRGCRILERNFRCRTGEIDLIVREPDTGCLCFVEVKYRRDLACGSPGAAVDRRKQQKILSTAQYYLLTHGYYDLETSPVCRFDVAEILGSRIRLIKNAFGAGI